jgi:hypothetical protein
MWVAVGCVLLGWLMREPEVRRLAALVREADTDAKAATDRLLKAWKDGYVVPDVEGEVVEEEALAAELQAIVNQYDDPHAQAKVEAAIRRKLNSGRTADQILMDAEVGQL